MKIIKRDGRAVDYDREKIKIAIEKANKEVRDNQKASKEEIKDIMKYIEDLGKKRMLVEDVQDIIEEKLMKISKYELAKKYIVYRYRRALVRKQNTTDESILGMIRNEKFPMNNKSALLASTQRDYIAGEVSKDLTKRLLLPERIVKAEEEGILHFHNADYFVQPIFQSCCVNLKDMLKQGTVINGKMIETPKSFQVACIVTAQIIATVASHQYGEQFIDLMYLGEYLRKSYEKVKKEMQEKYQEKISEEILENMIQDRLTEELEAGIQSMQYQINTSIATNGKAPVVTLLLHVDQEDSYHQENAKIVEEIIRQTQKGMKNEKGIKEIPIFPKLVYRINEGNNLTGGKYDYLTKLALRCSVQTGYPEYIGEKNFQLFWEKKGKFNQGIVSINLPQIGKIAKKEEETFWKELKERLELCKEALMCRHYALWGTKSDISPIHWQYGGIARLKEGENIDKLLLGEHSTISLGYSGLYEVTKIMTGEKPNDPKGHEFSAKVIKELEETIKEWKKETNLGFILCHIPEQRASRDPLNVENDIETSNISIPYRDKIDEKSFCTKVCK